jgi:hypothetical protein
MRCPSIAISQCLSLFLAGSLFAQATVSSVQPVACNPGQTTQLTLAGKNLTEALRVVPSQPGVDAKVVSVEAERATVELSVPAAAQLGPLGLYIATQDGPAQPLLVLVDDLPVVADAGNNHARDTAQSIPPHCAITGTGNGAQSDYYRFTVAAGQRVAFEVHTQILKSAFDPVLRLLDAEGNVLHLADDDEVGPECRFSHTFADAGDYTLEIRDSRYAAGGAYHLRIGDFPILNHALPLAIQAGQSATLRFSGPDAALAQPQERTVPADYPLDVLNVATRLPGGTASAWTTLLVRSTPQVTEPTSTEPTSTGEAVSPALDPLSVPVGISGQLSQPRERDSYSLLGKQGQTVRITARTRSLGCATLLQMQLHNAAGAKVAETPVNETDEWSFDYAFPEDGEYRLEVGDLLGRGGPGFGYWIDVQPAGAITLALKPDAATKEIHALEQELGCAIVDLQIGRFGYDGEIALSVDEAASGLRILNPIIPAKAAEARIYLTATAEWTPQSLNILRLRGQATDNPAIACLASSLALQRVKAPHVPFPHAWNDGVLWLAGVPKRDSFFALEPAAPIELPRPVHSHTVALNLKRIEAEFKAGVTLLGNSLPGGWSVAAKAEGDVYQTTFTRSADQPAEPEALPLLVVAEHAGRARLETVPVAVRWYDPLKVTLAAPGLLTAGGQATIRISLTRAGSDPQPVAVKLVNLPAGITAPAEPVTIAADQSTAELVVALAGEGTPTEEFTFQAEATSKVAGQDFTVAGSSNRVAVLAAPQTLEVYPPQVAIDGPKSRQRLVITGFDTAGVPRDWSRECQITSANPAVAEVRGSVIFPTGDGETEIQIQVGSLRQALPVRVVNHATERPVAFENEVLVALSKQGCNSGACHGSPSGKGGFRLSLRAFDMQLDELTLVREDFGRRVNPLDPEQSLLLIKPLMKVVHGGGMQLHKSDEAYGILRDWIAGGAQADPPNTPRCVRLEVYPNAKRVSRLDGGGQQLCATAHFADGSQRDVTHLVAYESSNMSVATVDVHGWVTPLERGETVILVRFLEHIESVPLMFIDEVEGFEWTNPPENNYVDRFVNEKLQQLQYLPAETCSDEEFLRRVYLDVIGVLPTVEETRAFLADSSGTKRARIIDELLEREEYAKFWALKWGDLLRMTSKLLGDQGVYKYHRWVEEAIRTNLPYDQFATALLTGSGSTLANPPANFYRTATDMNESVETISQVFLGARLQCAKCHNHPFERWTQDNYYGLGAFFQRVQRRNTQRPGEMFVWSSSAGEVTQPRTGQVMQPWLPQVGSITPEPDEDRRLRFTKWLVDPDNPYFAKIEANRIWSQLFSRGIVDPIDDFRDSNPPSNEPLLEALAQDFAHNGFDRKHLLRTILNSRTYQASCETNEFNVKDTLYFSHQEPRLLSAEQLLDAVNQTTALAQTFGNLPAGTRATHLPAPDIVKVDFLKVFGQPERSTVCACERVDDSNLGMAIELFNGTLIHEKLRDANNRFRKALADGQPPEEIIRDLYLAALCREPTAAELKTAVEHCQKREDMAAGLEDVCWALLNTDEFLFQH